LAALFYRRIGTDPILSPMFRGDRRNAAERLGLFLAEMLGGPAEYSRARGRPRMRKRHERFAIGPLEREAWLRHMRAAMVELELDESARDALGRFFEQAATDLVNGPGGSPRPRTASQLDRTNPGSQWYF
jgi:hemoglobin